MAVLKAPTKQPKTTPIQLRLDDEARATLTKYAEFLDSSPSYVVTEALKLLYRKDKEFQYWLAGPTQKQSRANHEGRNDSARTEVKPHAPPPPIRYA